MSTGKTLLNPEEYESGLTYEITLSPPSDYATTIKGRPETFYVIAFIINMKKLLEDSLMNITDSYYFCTEISKTGRPHLHGLIKFKTLKQIFLFITRFIHVYKPQMQIAINQNQTWAKPQIEAEADCKRLGFQSTVERPIYWNKYIHKQKRLWKAIGIDPVITSEEKPGEGILMYNIMQYY